MFIVVITNTEITFDGHKNGHNIHMLWERLTQHDILKQLTVTQCSVETRKKPCQTQEMANMHNNNNKQNEFFF
jgi:hypothetical protein